MEELPPPGTESVAVLTAQTVDPVKQIQMVVANTPKFSHDEYLPLKLSIKPAGTFCRRLRVTTTEEVWYRDGVLSVTVPAGFVSDLASIPRSLWILISPWDIALESLFHDVLYRTQPVKRVVADAALMSMLEERGSPWFVRWAVYSGVRMGGWIAWRDNAKELAAARAAERSTKP